MTGCQALGGRAQDVQADQAQHQRDVQGGAPDAGSAQVSDPMAAQAHTTSNESPPMVNLPGGLRV
jgi:hypothetical protein